MADKSSTFQFLYSSEAASWNPALRPDSILPSTQLANADKDVPSIGTEHSVDGRETLRFPRYESSFSPFPSDSVTSPPPATAIEQICNERASQESRSAESPLQSSQTASGSTEPVEIETNDPGFRPTPLLSQSQLSNSFEKLDAVPIALDSMPPPLQEVEISGRESHLTQEPDQSHANVFGMEKDVTNGHFQDVGASDWDIQLGQTTENAVEQESEQQINPAQDGGPSEWDSIVNQNIGNEALAQAAILANDAMKTPSPDPTADRIADSFQDAEASDWDMQLSQGIGYEEPIQNAALSTDRLPEFSHSSFRDKSPGPNKDLDSSWNDQDLSQWGQLMAESEAEDAQLLTTNQDASWANTDSNELDFNQGPSQTESSIWQDRNLTEHDAQNESLTETVPKNQPELDWGALESDEFSFDPDPTVSKPNEQQESSSPVAKDNDLAALWEAALGEEDTLLDLGNLDVLEATDLTSQQPGMAPNQPKSQEQSSAASDLTINATSVAPAKPRYGSNATLANKPATWRPYAPATTQPQPPTMASAESYADKNKGGYHSPYDLPDDFTKPKRRPAHNTLSFQHAPPISGPPSRSSSARQPYTTGKGSPQVPGSSFASPGFGYQQAHSSSQGQAAVAPTVQKPAGGAGFFAELPMSTAPRTQSALARGNHQYQPPQSSIAPPNLRSTQSYAPPPPNPRAPTETSLFGLRAPEKLQPYTTEGHPGGSVSGSREGNNRMADQPLQPVQSAQPAQPMTPPIAANIPQSDSFGRYGPNHDISRPNGQAYSPRKYGPVKTQSQNNQSMPPPSHRPLSQDVPTDVGNVSSGVPFGAAISSTPPPPSASTASMPSSLNYSPQKRGSYMPDGHATIATFERKVAPPKRSSTSSPSTAFNSGLRRSVVGTSRPSSAQGHAAIGTSTLANGRLVAPTMHPQVNNQNDAAMMPPQDDRNLDPLERWKGCPVFVWGSGGTIATSFPKYIPLYSASQPKPVLKCNPGEIKVRTANGLAPLPEQISKFPGPLKKGKKKELLAWLKSCIEGFEASSQAVAFGAELPNGEPKVLLEERILLWKVLAILVEHDGALSGTPGADSAVKEFLESSLFKVPEIAAVPGPMASKLLPDAMDPMDIGVLRAHLYRGQRKEAVWHAVDKRLWGPALLVSSTLDKDIWKQVVQEFVRKEVREKSLAALFQVFAGNWDESIDELVSVSARAGFQMMSTSTGPQIQEHALSGLEKWRETLLLILNNRSAGDSQALVSIGRILANYGRSSAAHVCFLFAQASAHFSGFDDPQADFSLLGCNASTLGLDFGGSLESIVLSEVFEFALTHSTTPSPPFPHLQAFKLYHAEVLAENGHRTEAQQYCDSINSIIHSKTKANSVYSVSLMQSVDDLSRRLSQAPIDPSSSWKPSMDKVSSSLWGKFNSFVTGDAGDTRVTSQQLDASDGSPFKPFAEQTSPRNITPLNSDGYGPYPIANTSLGLSNPKNPPSNLYAPRQVYDQIDVTKSRYAPQPRPSSSLGHGESSSHSMPNSTYPSSTYQSHPTTLSVGQLPQLGVTSTPLPYHPANSTSTPLSPPANPPSHYALNPAPQEPIPNVTIPPRQESYAAEPATNNVLEHLTPSYEAPSQSRTSSEFPGLGHNSPAGFSSSSPVAYEPPQQSSSGYEPPSYTSAAESPGVVSQEQSDDGEETKPAKKKKMGLLDDDDDDDELLAAKAAALKKEAKAKADREADEAFRKAAEADAARPPAVAQRSSWLGSWFRRSDASLPQQQQGPIKAKLGETSTFVFDKELGKWVDKRAGATGTSTPSAAAGTPPPPKSLGPPRPGSSRSVSSAAAAPPPPRSLSSSTALAAAAAAATDNTRTPPPAPGSRDGGDPPAPLSAIPPHMGANAHLGRSASMPASGPLPGAPSSTSFSTSRPPSSSGGGGSGAPEAAGSRPGSARPPSRPPSRPATTTGTVADIDDLLGAPAPRRPGGKGAAARRKGRYVDVMAGGNPAGAK